MPIARWPTLSAFYAANPARGRCLEVQVGSAWQPEDAGSVWRAAWLEATGEVIVVRADNPGVRDPGPVEVLGVLDRFTVEAGLRGWWHSCGLPGSLGWLRRTVSLLAGPDC